MKLSKYEKETIILTNEEDRYYSVYTFNQGLQKRLKNFAERYPECCYLSNSTKEGSETYIIQKGRLSLNLRPPYAKERIQKACSMPKGISLNTSFISIIIFSLNINYLHLYLIGVLVLSIHFFVRRYNQHHGTAHFILHPRNIHHVFRRLRLHNMIYYKTI